MTTKTAKKNTGLDVIETPPIKLPKNIIYSWEEAMKIYNDEPVLTIDLETTGLNPWKDRIAVVGMYGLNCKRPAVLHHPSSDPWPREFINWLSSRTPDGEVRHYITHNGVSFDIPYLHCNGMDVFAVSWWDTLISEQVSLISGRKNISVSLAQTAKRRLQREVKKSIDHESWKNPELSDEQIDYVVADISFLHKIKEKHLKECAVDTRERALRLEMALIPVVLRMTLRGFPIDLELFDTYVEEQEKLVASSYETLKDIFGDINFNSHAQIKKAFAAEGFAIPDTKAETISDMAYEYEGTELGTVLNALQTYKHAQKRVTVYNEAWRGKYMIWDQKFRKFVIHTRFRQVGTGTGRFSSNEPNLQQIPRDMRGVFGNVEGMSIVSADFKGIEAVVAASMSGDQEFIQALNTGDIHTYVASQILGIPMDQVTKDQRQVAKAATFTLIFAGGPDALIRSAKGYNVRITHAQASEISNNFYRQFSSLARTVRDARTESRKQRITLVLPTGLRRQLLGRDMVKPGEEDDSLSPQRILNTRVQGTAAAGLKYSLIEMLNAEYKDGCLADMLCITVHDEIVAVVPDEDAEWYSEEMRKCMVSGMARALREYVTVPIEVEPYIGKLWGK